MEYYPEETTTRRTTRRKPRRKVRVVPILLLTLLVLAGSYWLTTFLINFRPLITSIPLVAPGGQVTINGSRFGKQAVKASLVKDGWLIGNSAGGLLDSRADRG